MEPTHFYVLCPYCGKECFGPTISQAKNEQRFHMEQRHLGGEIETDT